MSPQEYYHKATGTAFHLFPCSSNTVSPWYNRSGWLGVKHQFTYLLQHCELPSAFPL